MCDYAYFDTEKNCPKCPLELIGVRYHLVVAFCMIILKPYILQGVMINVSKAGNTKRFSKAQFMVHSGSVFCLKSCTGNNILFIL